MSARRKTVVGVIFGGRSVEHDVSIVTAQQIMQALDQAEFDVVPIYISRDGKWFTGSSLRSINLFKDNRVLSEQDVEPVILSPDVRHHGLIINPASGLFKRSQLIRLDAIFPAIHGTHGEDGTLQGLFELADIPYVGFATMGSALTNDKIMTKHILRQQGIPVVPGVDFTRSSWLSDPDTIVGHIESDLAYPVFVKPATLGSSIGVGRADNPQLLRAAIDVAVNFDRRVLVERAVSPVTEINCSVIGYDQQVQASVLEQPVSWDEFLSYEDKYLRGGDGMKSADRIIPAPLDDDLTSRIRQTAVQAFRAVDGRGIVRIDFLLDPDKKSFYVNELNTLPGSLAFYLWQASDMEPAALVRYLVELARDAYADKRRNMYDYRTNLVELAAGRGLKGAKGAKSHSPSPSPAKTVSAD